MAYADAFSAVGQAAHQFRLVEVQQFSFLLINVNILVVRPPSSISLQQRALSTLAEGSFPSSDLVVQSFLLAPKPRAPASWTALLPFSFSSVVDLLTSGTIKSR